MQKIDVNEMYGKPSLLKKEEFLIEYNVSENGLTDADIKTRISKYGMNETKQSRPKRWYHYLAGSLFSPFNSILLGIIFVLIYTDIILPEVASYANIIVIIILILASTLLSFFEEFRANKAANKLKELVSTTCTVLRNGQEIKIPVKDLTVGDVVLLSAGDMVPADIRVVEAKDLYIGQSSLTGESDAVRKNVESDNSFIEDITDIDTVCFMGTNVISGYGKGIVFGIGDNTYFGAVADTINLRKT